MMVQLRLITFFLWILLVNTVAFIEHFNDEFRFSILAYGLLKSILSILVFSYGKWFCTIFRKSIIENKNIFLFEYLFLPAVTVNLFSISMLGFELLTPFYVLSTGFGILLMLDRNKGISNFLWKFRVYDFSDLPDDGVVSREIINKCQLRIILMVVVLPLLGLLLKTNY